MLWRRDTASQFPECAALGKPFAESLILFLELSISDFPLALPHAAHTIWKVAIPHGAAEMVCPSEAMTSPEITSPSKNSISLIS